EAGRPSALGPQWANWKQEEPAGLGGGRQLSMDGTSRMNREVQVRNSVRGSGGNSPGLLGGNRFSPSRNIGPFVAGKDADILPAFSSIPEATCPSGSYSCK